MKRGRPKLFRSIDDLPESKICKICTKDKPIDDFYLRITKQGYIHTHPYCKTCHGEFMKKNKVKNETQLKFYHKDYNTDGRKNLATWYLRAILRTRGIPNKEIDELMISNLRLEMLEKR